MAFSIGSTVDRINGIAVAELPVGKWVLFGAGLGLSTAVINAMKVANVQSYLSGPGLAYALKKVPMLRNFLGNTLSEVVAISAGTVMLDDQLQLSHRIREGIASAADALGVSKVKTIQIQYGPEVDLDKMLTDLQAAISELDTAKAAAGSTPTTGPTNWLGEIPSIGAGMPQFAIPEYAGPSSLGSIPAGEGYNSVEDIVSRIAF